IDRIVDARRRRRRSRVHRIPPGQSVSAADHTMSHMGNVVELAAWRADRPRAHAVGWDGGRASAARSRVATTAALTGWHPSFGGPPDPVDPAPPDTDERFDIGRLERAVGRLDRLAEAVLRTRGALAPDLATEPFAV